MNVYSIPDLISKNSYSASGRTMDGVGTALPGDKYYTVTLWTKS